MADSKLMIVDDAPFMRMVLRHLAFQASWTSVVEAANGTDAIQLFEDVRPNVVLLDIEMPGSDGLTVLQRIRGIDKTCHVAMLSAQDHKEKVQEALAKGASEFIPKPFDHAKMLSFMMHWKK